MPEKKKILILIDWFDPAYKAGGPVRSILNFVHQLKGLYDIHVLTSDADLDGPLEQIKKNDWHEHASGGFKVCYLDKVHQKLGNIHSHINEINPDAVYLNSMFSLRFTLAPLFYKWLGKIKSSVIIAPRGMLKSSALSYKPFKKKLFLTLFKLLGWHKLIRFQATDPIEYRDILLKFGKVDVLEVSNFPGIVTSNHVSLLKEKNALRLLYVGRIHAIKSLDFLLQSLIAVKGNIQLSIFGVLEDEAYWQQCKVLINRLPSNIVVEYLGDVAPHHLQKIYQEHHVFALPTKGENFGHAIFDAFAHGLPVLISDQTPWCNLETIKAGWDLPLNDVQAFTDKMNEVVAWSDETYQEWKKGAHQLALKFVQDSNLIHSYQKLFQ